MNGSLHRAGLALPSPPPRSPRGVQPWAPRPGKAAETAVPLRAPLIACRAEARDRRPCAPNPRRGPAGDPGGAQAAAESRPTAWLPTPPPGEEPGRGGVGRGAAPGSPGPSGLTGPAPTPGLREGEGRRGLAVPHARCSPHPACARAPAPAPSPAEFNRMPTPTPCATPRPAQQPRRWGRGRWPCQAEGMSARESRRQRETRGGRKRACAPPPASGEAEPQQ
jgi:hypothetical protein